MPGTGMSSPIGQTTAPINSAVAVDEIPARKLYIMNNGQPLGSPNSQALNSGANFDFGSTASGASSQTDFGASAISIIASQVAQSSEQTSGEIQASYTRTASNFDDTNARIGVTQDQITALQTTVDANQASNEGLFGFQSIEDGNQGVWNYNASNTFFTPVEDLLVNASAGASIIMSQSLLRLQSSVQFLVWYVFAEESEGFYDVEWLNAATIAGFMAAKTDPLTYLQAVLPSYPWQPDQDGTGLIGMSWQSSTDGIFRSYYWSPLPASVYDFYHLWDYTPTSGPPTRNGIDDFMQFLALTPVQWSTPPLGGG